MRFIQAFAPAVAFALAGLAGCDSGGIGSGNALETVELKRATGVLGTESNRSFLCVRDTLALLGTFTDGSVGDFSTRAQWSSANPAVLQVSNGDILVDPADPSRGAFVHGTLVPLAATAPGQTVRVTATFVGLSASYDVSIGDPGPARIIPQSQPDAADPVLPQNVAVGSTEQLFAFAEFDGHTINVTNAADWSFAPDASIPDFDDVALIGASSGVVAGLAPAGPLTVRATFSACDRVTTTQVRVRDLAGLALAHEFTPQTTSNIGQVVIGTTERLRVRGTFAEGTDQDLGQQVSLTSSAPTVASVNALGLRTGIAALTAGSTQIGACFDPAPTDNDADAEDDPVNESCSAADPNRVVSAATLPIAAIARTLASVAILPQNPSIDALGRQQFLARGTYADGATQDITRHVAWSSSNTAVAGISGLSSSAGLALSLAPGAGTSTIGATSTVSDPDLVAPTTTLCVFPPATPDAERVCPPPSS